MDSVPLQRIAFWPNGRWKNPTITRLELSVRSCHDPSLPRSRRRRSHRAVARTARRDDAERRACARACRSCRCTTRSAVRRSIRASRSRPSSLAARTRWHTPRPSRSRPARRGDQLMFNPLYIHAARGARQNPLAASDHLGRQQRRPQGALSDGRAIHVWICLGAEEPNHARLQGSGARQRRAGDRRPAVPARPFDPGTSSATPSTRSSTPAARS